MLEKLKKLEPIFQQKTQQLAKAKLNSNIPEKIVFEDDNLPKLTATYLKSRKKFIIKLEPHTPGNNDIYKNYYRGDIVDSSLQVSKYII